MEHLRNFRPTTPCLLPFFYLILSQRPMLPFQLVIKNNEKMKILWKELQIYQTFKDYMELSIQNFPAFFQHSLLKSHSQWCLSISILQFIIWVKWKFLNIKFLTQRVWSSIAPQILSLTWIFPLFESKIFMEMDLTICLWVDYYSISLYTIDRPVMNSSSRYMYIANILFKFERGK